MICNTDEDRECNHCGNCCFWEEQDKLNPEKEQLDYYPPCEEDTSYEEKCGNTC